MGERSAHYRTIGRSGALNIDIAVADRHFAGRGDTQNGRVTQLRVAITSRRSAIDRVKRGTVSLTP
jgi:hypothetical protein